MDLRARDRDFWKNFGRELANTLLRCANAVEFEMDFDRIRVMLPNFNSSIRAERSFAIRYLIVVTKPLCGNLDICLNCYFRSRNSVRVLSVADRD